MISVPPAKWSSAGFILDLIKIVVTMNREKNLGFFSLHIKSGMLRCLQNQAMEQLSPGDCRELL